MVAVYPAVLQTNPVLRYFSPRSQKLKTAVSLQQRAFTAKRAGIQRRNPYHTRHTFASRCEPVRLSKAGWGINAQMAYEACRAWIEELNGDRVAMLAL